MSSFMSFLSVIMPEIIEVIKILIVIRAAQLASIYHMLGKGEYLFTGDDDEES